MTSETSPCRVTAGACTCRGIATTSQSYLSTSAEGCKHCCLLFISSLVSKKKRNQRRKRKTSWAQGPLSRNMESEKELASLRHAFSFALAHPLRAFSPCLMRCEKIPYFSQALKTPSCGMFCKASLCLHYQSSIIINHQSSTMTLDS